MPRAFRPSVVTGNDLVGGHVVYLAADDGWTRELSRAEVLTDEAHAQLRLLDGQRRALDAVGVHLAEVDPAGPRPAHLRERLRADGPPAYAGGRPHAEEKG